MSAVTCIPAHTRIERVFFLLLTLQLVRQGIFTRLDPGPCTYLIILTFQAAYLGICSSAGRASCSVNLENNYFHGRSVRGVWGAHLMAFSLPVYIGMPTLFVACVSRYSDTHTRALLSRTLPSIHQSVPSTTQKERRTTLTCCAEFHQIGGDAPWNWTRFNSIFWCEKWEQTHNGQRQSVMCVFSPLVGEREHLQKTMM